MGRITIRTIAKELGLSATAVSHALRNRPNIGLATRERVQAKARELGYRPNAMVQALMADLRQQSRSDTLVPIAVVYSEPKIPHGLNWQRPAMDEEAEKMGYRLDDFFGVGEQMRPERLLQILQSRNISSMILQPQLGPSDFKEGSLANFALAGFNYSSAASRMHRASLHHSMDMDQVVKKIFGAGFRRPGFITTESTDRSTKSRWVGRFFSLMWERGDLSPDAVLCYSQERGLTIAELASWHNRYRADSLIVADHETLRVLEAWFDGSQPWIPIACMNIWWKGSRFSGNRQNLRGVVRESVRLLVEQLHLGQCGIPDSPRTVLLPGKWVEGESLGSAPVRLERRLKPCDP